MKKKKLDFSFTNFSKNNVSLEFLPHLFYVKDLCTGERILCWTTNGGVYVWLNSPTKEKPLSSYDISSFLCNSCQCNKSHKLPFSTSTIISSSPLQVIHSYVWSSPIILDNNFKYYDNFVNHFTKYVCLYPLKQKSDDYIVFVQFT